MYYMSESAQQKIACQELWVLLQATLKAYNQLVLKEDNFKLDLDSSAGQEAFRSYVQHIEALINLQGVEPQCRQFRQQYTKAYRVLYSQSDLGYIPQIFDAAQEGFTCIWVNAQCYIFEAFTLVKGQKLVETYFRLIQIIRLIILQTQNKSNQIPLHYRIQLREKLQDFDANWIAYEKAYIEELIVIQDQAKKTILDTVYVEEALTEYEANQRIRGKIFYQNQSEFHEARRKLCLKISKLNSIANINGKGRDDLSYQILLAAENLLTKISDSQSKSLRTVAEKIRESFNKLREVLKGFAENIELVDPQLRNNIDLVEALAQYEVHWEKGKRYFLEKRKQCQILAFSTILEAAKEKYPTFKDLLEFSDPSVFWMIASVVVLNSLQGEDQGLAESFLQQIKPCQRLQEQYTQLKQLYSQWKLKQTAHKSNQLYNSLQKKLLGEEQGNLFSGEIANKIKEFAVSLERLNPTDWNDMLSVILTEEG